jgi:hypothetical protein
MSGRGYSKPVKKAEILICTQQFTIVDELIRQGLLREKATGWDVSKTVEAIRGAVQDSLRRIIEQQESHVRPEDQELLEAASLAGREFSAAALTAVSNQATEDVEARLAALTHQGQFLRAGGLVAWPDGTVAAGYSFRHDLYREILYNRVPPSRQRRWPRRWPSWSAPATVVMRRRSIASRGNPSCGRKGLPNHR